LSAVVTQIVDTSVGAVIVGLLLPLFGVWPTAAWVWIPVLVLALVLLTTGVTLLASCLNVFFRDAKHLVQIVVSFGIFFTPVFFKADTFGLRGLRYMMGNPLGPVLEGFRLSIVEGHSLLVPIVNAAGLVTWSPWYLVWSLAWGLFGTAAAAVVFHRAEFAFAEYV
jgi:ABC-type polysaccharide/polyol phosphate export permease